MDLPSGVNWWNEVRTRLEHTARNFPSGREQRTIRNLLADPEALELVLEPFSGLEVVWLSIGRCGTFSLTRDF
jgi:hypothetical protein